MKTTHVYMCSKGHLHYCDDPPKRCKHQGCDSTDFGVVSNDFEMEDDDGVSGESEHDSN